MTTAALHDGAVAKWLGTGAIVEIQILHVLVQLIVTVAAAVVGVGTSR